MRGLAFRASSPFPFFVTCRGGIRTRRISHGTLPLNCNEISWFRLRPLCSCRHFLLRRATQLHELQNCNMHLGP